MNDERVPLDSQNSSFGTASDSESYERVQWLHDPSLPHRITKRAIDIIFSILVLILLMPVSIVIALVIKLTSEGPIFFRQMRLGYHAKPFQFLKFRSMYVKSNSRIHEEYVERLISGGFGKLGEASVSKISSDPRITPIGRFLRKTSWDEIPQLINVLQGHMSLVGPRPPIPYEWKAYEDWQRERLHASLA